MSANERAPHLFEALFKAFFYDGEIKLLKELGLNVDVELNHGEWIELGTYEHRYQDETKPEEPAYRVVVFVNAMPAKFWRFEIEPLTTDGRKCVMTTGSGEIQDYWPTVKGLAEGMIVVEPS